MLKKFSIQRKCNAGLLNCSSGNENWKGHIIFVNFGWLIQKIEECWQSSKAYIYDKYFRRDKFIDKHRTHYYCSG